MGASAGSSRGRARRGGIVGINVTPMVDVMLVLLVIMMVSATYIVSRALKVELPKSASSDESAQGPITVTLTRDHQFYVNQELVSGDAELVARFQKARAAPGEPSLVVTADGAAQHGWVVHVIDLAKQQGIVKFAISVQSGE
jgi:biopolymer transport protein ExbD